MPASIVYEPFAWQELKPWPVIGVDEVGRGCLAGPVYASAVLVASPDLPAAWSESVTDSKKLTGKKRQKLHQLICEHYEVAVAWASVEEIDELNILNASLLAMQRAVQSVCQKAALTQGHILVDGRDSIPGLLASFVQSPLIKGDLRAFPVAASSIVAKVERDNLMNQLHSEYPQYGFAKHKGYSTLAHKNAVREFGPCRQHRRSFRGVKEFCSPTIFPAPAAGT